MSIVRTERGESLRRGLRDRLLPDPLEDLLPLEPARSLLTVVSLLLRSNSLEFLRLLDRDRLRDLLRVLLPP